MDRRSLFYWSREFASGLDKGDDYSQLANVIAINIVNFEAVSVDDFHTVFHLWEDTHKDCLLTDALEIHFIDVKKFNALPEKNIKNDPLHRWLTFFDQNISDDLLKELMKNRGKNRNSPKYDGRWRGHRKDCQIYWSHERAYREFESLTEYEL